MIILVSDDPLQVESISTHLKQKRYLYSVAANGTRALDAAKADRVSLFLIDCGCASFDGFEICRTIKSDEALHSLPVILLTDLSDVSMLLSVLDCSADAFITKPCDPQSLLATIDDLRNVEVGKKTPSIVRTRFVVTQDGRNYSVAADRRQLLEFLLSVFELAVRIYNEQELMRSDLQNAVKELNDRLSTLAAERDATVRNLHGQLEERNRTIGRLNTEIQAKEEAEALLHTQTEKLFLELNEKGAALTDTQQRLADEGAKRQSLNERIGALVRERDQLAASQETATSTQSQVQTELEAQRSALEQEQRIRASLEAEMAELREKYASAQQFLDSASRDIGVLNAALAEEREKRKNAEERLDAAIRENENKDRAIKALNDDRSAHANELNDEKGSLSGRDATTPVLLPPDTSGEDTMPQQTAGTTPHPPDEEPGQQNMELPPLLPSVQMTLPDPNAIIQLPEAKAPEPDVPVTAPKKPDAVHDDRATSGTTSVPSASLPFAWMPAELTVSRDRWFDMIKWVHHTDTIPQEQRKDLLDNLVRMSRLVQKGRHLTSRQEDTMRALLARIQALGYRLH